MRLNKYLASATSLSRRAADAAIEQGRVMLNGVAAVKGTEVKQGDEVKLDALVVRPPDSFTTIMLHKPVGYVCSRSGQGSATVFDLLPVRYQHLQPIGRLDKDSSGLLLLTNDGQLAEQLSHPRYGKTKMYVVALNKPLQPLHQQMIADYGVTLEDGPSRFQVAAYEQQPARSAGAGEKRAATEQTGTSRAAHRLRADEPALKNGSPTYQITMQEGRNRQIRRTFAALGYTVTRLHRTHFGSYQLADLPVGKIRPLPLG